MVATNEEKQSFIEPLTEECFKTERPPPSNCLIILTLTQLLLSFSLRNLKTLEFKDPKPQTQILSMVESQNLVPNLSEMMAEYAASEAEVHLEPRTETTPKAEPERHEEEQNPA